MRVIGDAAVEPVVRALLGAVDVEGGGTDEQRVVIEALVRGLWSEHGLDIDALEPLDPAGAAAAIADPADRRRAHELLVVLEFCRHPLSEPQLASTGAYVEALDVPGAGVHLARTLFEEGAEQATADYARFSHEITDDISEPSLLGARHDDPALASRLRDMQDLPPGTLGFEYMEFHRRNGLPLPSHGEPAPAVMVAHDMNHVIAGYEPTGPGEIALGAMQIAMADNPGHWIVFLSNLAIHEAGYLAGFVVPKSETLARPGAADAMAEGLRRGDQCTGDFSAADHLEMVELPLVDVRKRFGVPPLREVP